MQFLRDYNPVKCFALLFSVIVLAVQDDLKEQKFPYRSSETL